MNTQFVVGESSATSSHLSYNVFLSFRGEDTRKIFTGHLYFRLCQVEVNTFIDDEELRCHVRWLSTPKSVVSLLAFRRTQLFCVSFCFIRMLRGLSQHPSQYFRGFIDRQTVSAELRKSGQGFAWGQKWSPGAGPAQGVGSGRDNLIN
ncbi:hypothetical protein MTR67_041709 [Solanum verrucosum]|uniref:TIR domain-containing protein n=1 Tax=Solanum verrucosum TaxID=315347 RepID=A0AAF0ULY1_SOLVR|nr:hypothetical protein MTR67_041709 [Solanum verrucosum]